MTPAPLARRASILGAYSVPTGPLWLDCLHCGTRAAELAKPCQACGVIYDEHATAAIQKEAA